MAQPRNDAEVQIKGMIESVPAKPSWPKIFQVPPYYRELNKEAYEPRLISIGPYHRQNDRLKAMETLKVRFLKDLLERRNGNRPQRSTEVLTDVVKVTKNMMERARMCYSESLDIKDDEFLKMMIIDGCFIVELIHKFVEGTWHDPILKVRQIYNNILRDLVLVENQLPFFVPWEFLGNAFEDRSPYIDKIIEMFEKVMPGLRVRRSYDENSINQVKHILDLLLNNWLPSEDSMGENESEQEDIKFIPSATELREAGVKFRSKGSNLFDVKFENGTLCIPAVSPDDNTEGLYCNIIACEQFDDTTGSPKYLTDYTTVMDCLIDTGKDVELLCHKEIMDRWLGTDEAAAKMFNRLGREVIFNKNTFFYTKLFKDVNTHYKTPWNKRMASLRHNYFNTPWALISFLAAAFLLLLALLQTTFTIFPRS